MRCSSSTCKTEEPLPLQVISGISLDAFRSQIYYAVAMFSSLSETIDVDTSMSDSSIDNTTAASSTCSLPTMTETSAELHSSPVIEFEIKELFSTNVAAKIWRVAKSHLEQEVSSRSLHVSSGLYAGQLACSIF